jgi:hypothetical protein
MDSTATKKPSYTWLLRTTTGLPVKRRNGLWIVTMRDGRKVGVTKDWIQREIVWPMLVLKAEQGAISREQWEAELPHLPWPVADRIAWKQEGF